jgi:glycosyltransferase involved in cell wall biosynthesis
VPSLRVGFDGHAFDSPAGGVRRYTTELARAMIEIDPELRLIAVGAGASTSLPQGVVRASAGGWLPTNLGWCIDGLPRALRRTPVDVFHAPAYTAPLWGVHPLVVTIHDVSYERRPEWYPYRIDRARRWFYRRSALAADIVITDSEFSRREIEAAYGLRSDRVRVIPLGVGAPFTPDVDRTPRAAPGVPLILHVGDLHARRNVGILVEALAQLRARDDTLTATELVLAGVDRGVSGLLVARAKALGVADALRFVSGAGDDAIVALMRQASVFAYPSIYEGFGLPVLEAMACGVPVVASTAASVPEVVGEAGLLADPHDVRAWYDALVAVLTSPARAAALCQAGLTRAAAFSWHQTAVRTLNVYQTLAGGEG